MRNLMISLLENVDRQQAEMMRQQLELAGDAIAPLIINALILAVMLFFFSVIGGLIGAALFEKRKGGAVPPPPPATGGPGGFAA
jgi:hypothetical protein